MRLFVSIDLPEVVRAELKEWLPLLPDLRYTKEAQLHLTLLFLGECDDDQVGLIKERLRAVDFEPFRLVIKGIGAFPDHKNPRVIWAGVEKSKELHDLQRQVRNQLSEFADQKGDFTFKPHITLARAKKGFGVKNSESLFKMQESLSVIIRSVSLKKSDLSDKGSVHTVLVKIHAHG